MGKGGISGAQGSVTLLIKGSSGQIQKFRRILKQVKNEPEIAIETNCKTCVYTDCWYLRE